MFFISKKALRGHYASAVTTMVDTISLYNDCSNGSSHRDCCKMRFPVHAYV